MTDADVIIHGGGPVGMGLAIELGQRGIRTIVVERHAQPSPIPKGQNLTQRTAEHFHFWGCEADLRTAHPLPPGAGIGGITIYGTALGDWHYDWLNRAHVRDYYLCANARLPQYATERVLRARVAELPAVTVHYGLTGQRLDMGPDRVTLTATDANGQEQTLSARFIVGCDGSRSMVRTAAGIPETRAEHNRVMALIVFRSTDLHDLLSRYPGKAFYNVLHPDFDGYWQFFGRVDHGTSWFFHAPVPPGTTKDTLDPAAMLTRAVGRPFAHDILHTGLWDLRVALADTYRRGAAFVAGDAAHSHPPYGGYGINTGFEDARNLGWKLAATLQGWGGPHLLDSYDAERRPVFASTARDFIERYIADDRAFLTAHNPDRDRDAFAQAWGARGLDADDVLAFEPNYEGSPIIGGPGQPSARGTHDHRARAGHHLSPRPLPDGRNAFHTLGPGFTLFATDPATRDAFARATADHDIPLHIEPQVAPDWDAPCVLVRPDQFVAHAGDPPADPAATLARAAGWAA
jgi:2-polyprenyl-6-methoxyphenol hydroxylase-like FAD-dependent oxidoreductase